MVLKINTSAGQSNKIVPRWLHSCETKAKAARANHGERIIFVTVSLFTTEIACETFTTEIACETSF
jgi:hypothetical protein